MKTSSQPAVRHMVRDADDLAESLRDVRKARGMSQAEVAEWIGAPRLAVNHLERGQFTTQVLRLLDTLAVLGVDLVLQDREGATS